MPNVLRDPDAARQYLLQGLWFQRVSTPGASNLTAALNWCLAIAESGQPVPPTGFVADVGNLVFGRAAGRKSRDASASHWPAGLARTYEDIILGPAFADPLFERAAAAIRRLEPDKQARGVAYLIRQICENSQIDGVEIPPGIVRGLLQSKPEEVLRQGWESLRQAGPTPILIQLYEQLTAAARRAPRLLANEDVIALEQQTALLPLAQYIAHRQVLQMAAKLEGDLPRLPPAPSRTAREAPTRLLDEDAYPVGGYASISTRGSIESLLHSQLAFMEPNANDRPDLFDFKFLRDELYYYSRDENRFLRRRRSFIFVLYPDLTAARFKDDDLPFQRSVLVLATLVAACQKLSEWLTADGLTFEFLFLEVPGQQALEEEQRLLRLLFRESLESGTARIDKLGPSDMRRHVKERAETSLTRSLSIRANAAVEDEVAFTSDELLVDGPRPDLRHDGEPSKKAEEGTAVECWAMTLARLLANWI